MSVTGTMKTISAPTLYHLYTIFVMYRPTQGKTPLSQLQGISMTGERSDELKRNPITGMPSDAMRRTFYNIKYTLTLPTKINWSKRPSKERKRR